MSITMTLYQHSKRREIWGYAILAEDGDERRSFQFQDGKLRTFKRGFFGLMEVVENPPEEARLLFAELSESLDIARARKEVVRADAKASKSLMTLDDQKELFRTEYPDGFGGDAWDDKTRGARSDRRLKRHRAPALALAAEKLAEGALQALIDQGDFQAIIDVAVEVLRTTDLVRPADDLAPLTDVHPSDVEPLAKGIADLLHGQGAFDQRFDAFVQTVIEATDEPPTWPFATTLPALVHPEGHIHVRLSTMRRQAQWLRPNLTVPSKPSGVTYLRILEMGREVQTALTTGSFTPADLVDVYDFMRLTLRPKARQLLAGYRTERAKARKPADDAE